MTCRSRAALLLEKEHFKMKREPMWGIYAKPFEDNIFHWEAVINGPRDTPWDGGAFQLYMIFQEDYNRVPPKVFFQTVPFHPNVEKRSGIPCVDFLGMNSTWKEHYSVQYILLSLQTMLACPVFDNPVNTEAAEMHRSSPHQYSQMVKDCVYASRRLDVGLQAFLNTSSGQKEPSSQLEESGHPTSSCNRPSVKISFEDYHALWSELATSQPVSSSKQQIPETVLRKSLLVDPSTFADLEDEIKEELRRQLLEHNILMYGKFKHSREWQLGQIAQLQATKLQLVEQLKIAKHDSSDSTGLRAPVASRENLDVCAGSGAVDGNHTGGEEVLVSPRCSPVLEDPTDEEVENLMQWTENLPEVI